MGLKLLSLLVAVVLVAACSSASKDGSGANMGGQQATTAGATPGTEADLVANVGNRVFFAFNQADLSSEAQATLKRQAEWLQKYPSVTVTIEGNCDERGTREYNLALGQRRADAVKNFLVAQGVAASRISTISYGKERPIATGHDEAAWAQNRNTTTVVN